MILIHQTRKPFLNKGLIPTNACMGFCLWATKPGRRRGLNKKRAAEGGSQGKTGRKSEVAQKRSHLKPERILDDADNNL
jgi:hypothetical protein